MTSTRAATRLWFGVLGLAFVVSGCPRRSKPDADASASASASAGVLPAPVASGFPAPDVVSSLVNPKGEAAYTGPTGSVRGRVVVTGDPSPAQADVLASIPESCGKGREAYAKVFREGPGRSLADALIAVTGYKGYVPERAPTVDAKAEGCFWGTRTFVLTFGQRLDITSGDSEAYIPELLGEHGQPQLIATPGGKAASHLYPTRPGRYQVVDNLKLFMTAEVLVLKYSTHAVTGLDGRFEIPGIPAGPVNVSAMLPQTLGSTTRKVVVEAGKGTEELVLEIPFSAAEYAKQRAAESDAGAAASSSAVPVGSARKPGAALRDAGAPRAAPSLRPAQKSAPGAESIKK